jgi:hypothetical protein
VRLGDDSADSKANHHAAAASTSCQASRTVNVHPFVVPAAVSLQKSKLITGGWEERDSLINSISYCMIPTCTYPVNMRWPWATTQIRDGVSTQKRLVEDFGGHR